MDGDTTALRPLPRRVLPPLGSDNANVSAISRNSPTLNLEDRNINSEVTPKKRRRRKRTPRPTDETTLEKSDENPVNISGEDQEGEANISVQSKNARNRRRQAKSQRNVAKPPFVISNGHALTNVINDEDVVDVDRIDTAVSITTLPGVAGGGGSSQPQQKVYFQTTSGFKSHSNEWLENRQLAAERNLANEDDSNDLLITQTSGVALSFHRGSMFIALILHGFLAGFAIWEVVTAFLLNTNGTTLFFSQYQLLAQPAQTTYYLLLVFTFVSAMDRFDFGGKNIFKGLMTVDKGSWAVLVYFIAFMFNVGLSGLDFWLGTTAFTLVTLPPNSTLLTQYPNIDPDLTLTTWHVINTIRASFAVIGWLLIAVYPTGDATSIISSAMSWKYLDDHLLSLSKGSTLLGKYWVAIVLLLRLIVLGAFGDHVWSDEQREFTCNTKQPGCENVCFNKFSPVSNVRMWGLQMLMVSLPGAVYFVYVLHEVSREKKLGIASKAKKVNHQNEKKSEDILDSKEPLRGARKRWRILTNYVIPPELHRSRGRCIWKLYVIQIFARIVLEGVFLFFQLTMYCYRWRIPEVYRCRQWPCPNTVDCFISRPREKTIFFCYMYAVSFISIIVSVAELLYIAWTGTRYSRAKRQQHSTTHHSFYGPPPLYLASERWGNEVKGREYHSRHPEVKLKVNSLTYTTSRSSDLTSVEPSNADDVALKSTDLATYL